MSETTVRLTKLTIENFKNVVKGELSLENSRKPYQSSILGLYGQNGSGKTALIDVIQILKAALCGVPLPLSFAEQINVDAGFAFFRFQFRVVNDLGEYDAVYEMKLKKERDRVVQNLEPDEMDEKNFKPAIYDEVLSASFVNEEEKLRFGPVIDTRTPDVFLPKAKYQALIGKDRETMTDLLVAKKLAARTGRSFLFSKELLEALRAKQDMQELQLDSVRFTRLLEALVHYGNYELFVIHTGKADFLSMNALPLFFDAERQEKEAKKATGNLMIPMDSAIALNPEQLAITEKVIGNMNVVLQEMIPGLTIGVKELGPQVLPNGTIGEQIQLVSTKNSRDIPLVYESEGIKKIISILQLLIVVYNQKSITVAIDELDAGVFEYLLGELLRILSEKGKGQLLFTSHNLRPLETLDKGFIAFTTTNPEKRYIRMTNVKENNNLRDFYYRDIVLGEQKEPVYDAADTAEIAFAFREAGERFDA